MVSAGDDAYQVLGLPRDCSNADIKRAFQQQAKCTHPDLNGDKETTARFIRALAAYQILSDPEKRAAYDRQFSARVHSSTTTTTTSTSHASSYSSRSKPGASRRREYGKNTSCNFSYEDSAEDSEVVEWLRRYRARASRIVHEKELGTGSKLFESFQTDLVTAMRSTYFGPDIRALQGFPEVFEAEERAGPGITDVLHLVYGRFLFATVSLASEKQGKFPRRRGGEGDDDKLWGMVDRAAYERLELRINGEVKAHAMRRPIHTGDLHEREYVVDSISVFAGGDDERCEGELIGRVQGLAATDAGLKVVVFDAQGNVTHSVLQHRTPWVRHLHWYKLDDVKTYCDCRCRRARLLPSRYWIFPPRSDTHNIGGWYIETFKPRKRVPSSKLLHPALFILTAAYKTLDTECLKKQRFNGSLLQSASKMWWTLRNRWELWKKTSS